MKAKIYFRKDTKAWGVWLFWKGQRYYRFNYDANVPFSTERMARRIAEAINLDIEEKGKRFDPRQWFNRDTSEFNFRVYAEKWITQHIHGYAPSIKRDVERSLYSAISYLGKFDIREIRKSHIEDFLLSLPYHLSQKTKKNILGVLHKVFNDAFQNEIITRIPGWPAISVPVQLVKWIDADWQEKILAEIPERDRPIFIFIKTYGCRPGEARALQWDCIDFDKGTVTIKRTFSHGCNNLKQTTKSGMGRVLPLTDEIRDLVKIRGIGGYVFRNKHGRPYNHMISDIWNTARDRVGAPDVTLYQGTRHSFGSQRASEGHSLKLIGDILGHTKPQTTQRYAQSNLTGMRTVIPLHKRYGRETK